MADNRMFVVHIPTGLAVALGKRVGFGWCSNGDDGMPADVPVAKLFAALDGMLYDGREDAFALAMESVDCEAVAVPIKGYGERRTDGLVQLVL